MEELLQGTSEFVSSSVRWDKRSAGNAPATTSGKIKLWMALDGISILVAAVLATLLELHKSPIAGARGLWNGTLIHGRSIGILLSFFGGFAFTLILTSRRLNLYNPKRLSGILHEQRLSVQACLTSGLLLTGSLYLARAEDIPRSIVLVTIGLVVIFLALRLLVYRMLLSRGFERGVGTRNAVILGAGPEAHALRRHLDRVRHLGYTFKGFIEFPGSGVRFTDASGDVVGTFDTLFQSVRREFVDEIFITDPCEQHVINDVLEQARAHGVDLRLVPDMHGGLAWKSPIEYIGQFPTIPLHRCNLPEGKLLFKRGLDVAFSSLASLFLMPLFAVIAIAIKLDSKGPVFYSSERIGKKGRVFRCMKFRTMVRDAEKRRAGLMHMNERDGVLFKIADDPRVTKLGKLLRKYSLDELPQFFNVLRGEMSVVGPRPPLAGEVKEYKLSQLRRLDVTPGITGLWQVQARQDPSFDSYISLDVAYVKEWSIWLDLKIIARTIGVVFSGTGS